MSRLGSRPTPTNRNAVNTTLPARSSRSPTNGSRTRSTRRSRHSASGKEGFVLAGEAAFALGKLDRAEALLAEVRAMPPGLTPPYLRTHSARFAARLAAAQDEHELVEPSFEAAVQAFRDLGLPFYLAMTLLEQSEWLIARSRTAEAEQRLEEARAIFERLQARPWLDRLARAVAPAEEVAAPLG
jgi:hypothetical protein